MYYKNFKKILFFSLALSLFSGCTTTQDKLSIAKSKALEKVKETKVIKELKGNNNNEKPLKNLLILDVERSPVRVMRSLVMAYTSGDKAIGSHTVDMIIDFGNWNTTQEINQNGKIIGSLNE